MISIARILVLITTAGIFFLTACANLKSEGKRDTSWSLELKKGGCMDICPSYSIRVEENGNYNYRGLFLVKHKGERAGKLNKADLVDLKKRIQAINWIALDSSYGTGSNAPRKELHFVTATIDKKITYYRLEPPEIRQLELFIDTIIDHDEL